MSGCGLGWAGLWAGGDGAADLAGGRILPLAPCRTLEVTSSLFVFFFLSFSGSDIDFCFLCGLVGAGV